MSGIDRAVGTSDKFHAAYWHVGFSRPGINRWVGVEATAGIEVDVFGQVVQIRAKESGRPVKKRRRLAIRERETGGI